MYARSRRLCGCHANADKYTDGNANEYADCDSNQYSDGYANKYSDGYAHKHADLYTDGDTDARAHVCSGCGQLYRTGSADSGQYSDLYEHCRTGCRGRIDH